MEHTYESIMQHVKDGGDVTNFLTSENSLEPLKFIVKLESFRLILLHLNPNKENNITKIRLFSCIQIIGNKLGLPNLWADVKHLVQIRNDMIHDVSTTILSLNDSTALKKSSYELDRILNKCWKLARAKCGEVRKVEPNSEILTCKLFC